MKLLKWTAFLLVFTMLMGMMPVMADTSTPWKTIYVSAQGSDSGDGSKANPFKTLARAQEAVRDINKDMKGDIVVEVAGGTYYMDEPLSFRKEDSGMNGYRVIWRGIDRPTLSGGKELNGFVPSSDYTGLYEAQVDGFDRILQIYVNGKKRFVASTTHYVTGVKKPEKYDNDDWYDAHPNDMRGDSYNWYDPETSYTFDGFYMSKKDIGFWENPKDILFRWDKYWKTHYVPVEEILQDPDNPEQVILRMERGLWQMMTYMNHHRQYNYPKGDFEFKIINAMELLDSPGEFYYNRTTKKLYYMPEIDEDMSSATVVAPVIDYFACFYGNDYNDCVKNIDFEGFTIAHFASNAHANGYWTEQGTVFRTSSGVSGTGRSGVKMFFTDNVNFYDNYFYGFDSICFNLSGGNYNTKIVGNAFSDIGETAINIGHERHIKSVDHIVPENAGLLNLTRDPLRTAIYTSYVGDDWRTKTNYIGNLLGGTMKDGTFMEPANTASYVPDGKYEYKGTVWHSDPMDATNGEKSYVMYDFYDKFSLDKVAICWDDTLVSSNEKANFEVLASNDINFSEGNYTTLATQEGAVQGEIKEYEISDDTAYRYLMIRTLGATPLALSAVYALTSDLKPYAYDAMPKDITVSNNYLTRMGSGMPKGAALVAYYADGLTVTHNDVYDTGYSGFQIGWGWSNKIDYTSDVYCANNLIDTVCHHLYDGGGIYVLSRQKNSVYEGNYLRNIISGINALYTDSGSAGMVWRNNVVEVGGYMTSLYNDSIVDNEVYNNYGTHSTDRTKDVAPQLNRFEPTIPYAIGLPPEDAYKIMDEAGLEDKYLYLKSLVPKDVDNGHGEDAVEYSSTKSTAEYNNMLRQEASNVLSMGEFGTSLGMYPISLYDKFKQSYEAYSDTATVKQTVLLRDLLANIRDNVNRMSLEDTMDAISQKLSAARTVSDNCPCVMSFSQSKLFDTFGMMTQGSCDELNKRYAELVAAKENGSLSEYELLVSAEALYNDIIAAGFSADILWASADEAVDVEIDENNKQVIIYFDVQSELTNKKLDITVSPGALIATVLPSRVDLNKPLLIPVYCPANKGYKYWTVRGEYVKPQAPDYLSAENWFSLRSDGRHVSPVDGGLIIENGVFATMSKSYDAETNGASFSFTPMSNTSNPQFTMVLASQSYEIDNDLKQRAINRMEIDFEGSTASLYMVESSGKRTLVRKVYTSLSYNTNNSISFASVRAGDNTQINVVLNGETIFNELVSENLQGAYFGFVSKKLNIKIN